MLASGLALPRISTSAFLSARLSAAATAELCYKCVPGQRAGMRACVRARIRLCRACVRLCARACVVLPLGVDKHGLTALSVFLTPAGDAARKSDQSI